MELTKKKMQEDLSPCSSSVEYLKLELSATKFLTEEELRVQATGEIERLSVEEIFQLEEHTKAFARFD